MRPGWRAAGVRIKIGGSAIEIRELARFRRSVSRTGRVEPRECPAMDFGSQPVPDIPLIERMCDEFEIAWDDGERPRIEDYLRDAPSRAVRAPAARCWPLS